MIILSASVHNAASGKLQKYHLKTKKNKLAAFERPPIGLARPIHVRWYCLLVVTYHSLFYSKIRKDAVKFVVCCSGDWRLDNNTLI